LSPRATGCRLVAAASGLKRSPFHTIRQLTTGRKFDLIITFPEMDLMRIGYAVVLGEADFEQQDDWDVFFGTAAWRDILAAWELDRQGERLTAPLLRFYTQRLETIGYQCDTALPAMQNSKRRSMYRLVFASRDPRGLDFWQKSRSADNGMPSLIDLMMK